MTIKYGPFDTIPTPQMLPRGESYVILQVRPLLTLSGTYLTEERVATQQNIGVVENLPAF